MWFYWENWGKNVGFWSKSVVNGVGEAKELRGLGSAEKIGAKM